MALTLGRTRVRAHPLALMYPAMVAMLGGRSDAVALLMGLAVHEGAHLLAARSRWRIPTPSPPPGCWP